MVFLERDEELSELGALLDDAASGRGRLLLIEGQAGIGKTHLLKELQNLAKADDVRVLTARGGELERDFAFGVVRQLLEPLLARANAAERGRLLDGVAGLAEPVFAVSATEPSSDPTYGTLRGLYWLVANAAEDDPLVLAIDDLQWADEPSLRFLHFLGRRLDGMSVGVVLAARSEESEPGSEVLHQLRLEATPPVLRPAPLSDSAVGELVQARLGPSAGEALCAACHEATRGNPFLLNELVSELSRGDIPVDQVDPGAVGGFASSRLAAVVLMRIGRVGPSTPALARAIAVFGEGAEIAQAAELAGLDAAEGRALARRLVEAEILEGIEPVRFVHSLVQRAVYEDIPAGDRAMLHARAAKLLAEAGADSESIAAHYLAADPAGDPEAVSVLRTAAATALSRGAPDVAARYLRRALAEPPREADRIPVIGELGVVASLNGESEGLDHLRLATAEAEAGPPRAELALSLANALAARGEIEEAAAALNAAIASLPEADEERLTLEATLVAVSHWAQSTHAASEQRIERLAGLAGPDSRPGRMILAALSFRHVIHGDSASDAFALASAALEGGLLVDTRTDQASICDAISVPIFAERLDMATHYGAAALADARARGRVAEVVLTLAWSAFLAYRRGRIASAEAQAREALATAELGSFATGTVMFTAACLAFCLVEQGRIEEAQEVLDGARPGGAIPENIMGLYLLLAQGVVLLAGGKAEPAAVTLREVADRARGWMDQSPAVLPHRSLRALAAAQLGEVDEARRLAAEELELAQVWGTPGVIGAAQRIAGLVASSGPGIKLLREAVATLEGSGVKLEEAHALVDLGAALRRSGERTEGRERLAEGLELADECGASGLVEMAEGELRAAGARPRRRALSGVGSLTPSELRVAEMAAEGMTNKEIAQALFVTLRTVETHLSHTYAKLEIASRDQLSEALGGPGARH